MTASLPPIVRRGVLLLIVLGLLALFALVGITFVMLTSHERRSAEASRRADRYAEPADTLLNQALMQVLRGTENPSSVLGPHSLLEDLYGADVVSGGITGAAQNLLVPANIDLTVSGLSFEDLQRCYDAAVNLGKPVELVFLNGPANAADQTAFVVDAAPGASQLTIAPPDGSGLTATDLTNWINSFAPDPAVPIPFRIVEMPGRTLVGVATNPPDLTFPQQFIKLDIGPSIVTDPGHAKEHVGKVLTMLDGPAAGQTTRIVGVDPTDSNNRRVYVLPFANGALPNPNDAYALNGMPFAGTGFGYDPLPPADTDHLLGAAYTGPMYDGAMDNANWPYAFLPNPVGLPAWGTYGDPAGPGGANEDYDAPDFQNMLLAMQLPEAVTIGANTYPAGTTPIPSLHRPALINYWLNIVVPLIPDSSWPSVVLSSADIDEAKRQCFWNPLKPDYPPKNDPPHYFWSADSPPALKKADDNLLIALYTGAERRIFDRISLRPTDPDFTGSNPWFNPLWDGLFVDDWNLDFTVNSPDGICDYRWDVDNDGDGIADSIWVDLGMPARPTADGRMVKPLFAILCVDLDGRLNLNAHGTLDQAGGDTSATLTNPIVAGGVNQLPASSRGQGVGPAEVRLGNLLASGELAYLLQERTFLPDGPRVLGRYGQEPNEQPGWPGIYDSNHPMYTQRWAQFANKWFDLPETYDPTSGAPLDTMAYGTPLDLHGSMAVGLDLRGQPLYLPLGAGNLERAGNPYQLNLSTAGRGAVGDSAVDAPFGVAELERLLRPYDVDAGTLPSRIAELAPSLLDHTREVTTDNWSIPTAPVALPPELRANTTVKDWIPDGRATHVVDLLRAKVIAENGLNYPADVNTLNSIVSELVPPEWLSGLKIDLNRPWGNGRDDAPENGVIDEPGEAELFYYYDKDGNETSCAFDTMATRQLYARHLYVLMLALVDYNGDPDHARQVAQWAVNIVDFRDRDSIMTPFEYDINPFDGWDADGNVAAIDTGCGVVWGCERPELLITETLAFHNRRTKDTDGDGKQDQVYTPEGSLFVELYNPWTTREPLPGELYSDGGVALNKVVGGSPVWRMTVVDGDDFAEDPDDPSFVERTIYFDAGGGGPADGDIVFRPAAAGDVGGAIEPGQYAVIGPGTTYLSQRSDGQLEAEARQIVLTPPNSLVVAHNLEPSEGDNEIPSTTTDILPPVVIAIDSPQRLNLSHPIGGYAPYPEDESTYPEGTDPFDTDAELLASEDTLPRHKVIHLQRLANPLIAYNADTNPYLTVDSMQIDFTPYNGDDSTVNSGTKMLASHERDDPDDKKVLWQTVLDPPKPVGACAVEDTPVHEFPRILEHTLGYLNSVYHELDPDDSEARLWWSTDSENGDLPESASEYRGSPKTPFPWLTWLNRPFTSEMELLLTPRWRSAELLAHCSTLTGADPYTSQNFTVPGEPVVETPFPQTINFFYDDPASVTPNWKLHRLLDYVGVRSPFVGTELQGSPASFVGGNHLFHPPFNHIPNYREPGRVNINTIASEAVWNAVLGAALPSWSDLVASRRGYTPTVGTGLFGTNENYPTRFANPFRSFAGQYYTPEQTWFDDIDREVNATLLRPDGGFTGFDPDPLFQKTSSGQPYDDVDRNPYFRYQLLNRLGSTVTTQSNVYAVWITVGYFEVERWKHANGDDFHDDYGRTLGDFLRIHPDGYQLGQEYGADTGEIRRHRAFYMIDRSVPVGFQRGKNLNAENAILLRRFIE